MTIHLPDLRGPEASPDLLDESNYGWLARAVSGVHVPTLGDVRRCAAPPEREPAACEVAVRSFEPARGVTILKFHRGRLEIAIELTAPAPDGRLPSLRILGGEDVVTQLEGTLDRCRTRARFTWHTIGVDEGRYDLELTFVSQFGEPAIEPHDNRSFIIYDPEAKPALPIDSCALTLAPTTNVVAPTLGRTFVRPPPPPLIAVTPDGCIVPAWSTNARGWTLVPRGPRCVELLRTSRGPRLARIELPSDAICDAILWGDVVAVLTDDAIWRFDAAGCLLDEAAFVAIDGIALARSDEGWLVVVTADAVRLFRSDGSEPLGSAAFDGRGWYARHRDPAFGYDPARCTYRVDPSRVDGGCCAQAARELTDDEALFFRYLDDLPCLRERPGYVRTGSVELAPTLEQQVLDAGRPGTQWHRIVLFGEIPTGCVVRIQTRASDELADVNPLTPDGWSDEAIATSSSAVTVSPPDDERIAAADVLVLAGPGRYLGIRLTLQGDGVSSPRITSLEAEQPRVGIAKYLPRVFRDSTPEDDFLRRWLALFEQTTFDGVRDRLNRYGELFDPRTAPPEMLEYLAGWLEILSLDRFRSDPDAFRRVLAAAPELARTRGTPRGIELAIRLYTGFRAHVVDAFQTRSDFVLGSGAHTAVLGAGTILSREPAPTTLGDEPRLGCSFLLECDERVGYAAHHFEVRVPARYLCSDQDEALLRLIVETEKPAHATYALRIVQRAGFVVGVDAVLGQDTSEAYVRGIDDPATYGIALLNGPPRPRPLGLGFALGRDSRLPTRSGPPPFTLGEPGATVGQSTYVA